MIHPEEWTQEKVDSFYRWIREHHAFGAHVADEFPNLVDELRQQGLRPEDADELSKFLQWLRILPYADQRVGREILIYYYTGFQGVSRRLRNDPRGRKLCALFPVLARMMFQGASVFPAQSAQLASALIHCLRQYPRGTEAFEVLADLITDPADGRFLHGHNADELTREQVNALIRSEHMRRQESFEDIYETEEKYKVHKLRVMEAEEFRHDWEILKKRFPADLVSGKSVLRSTNNDPPRMKRVQALSRVRPPTFEDVFDVFCWKWFLDGMAGDEPIVTKLSFDVTPFGTTVFIPGYWSFDPKRDIKWRDLLEFHRSRCVKRQGEAFEQNRLEREEKERRFLEADRISTTLGERGDARIRRCIEAAGLPNNTDPSYVYHVLGEAKRNRSRAQPTTQQQTLPLSDDSQTLTVSGLARVKATVKRPRRRTRPAKTKAK